MNYDQRRAEIAQLRAEIADDVEADEDLAAAAAPNGTFATGDGNGDSEHSSRLPDDNPRLAGQPNWLTLAISCAAGVLLIAIIAAAAATNGEESESGARTQAVDSASVEVFFRITGTAETVSVRTETPDGPGVQALVDVPLQSAYGGGPVSYVYQRGDWVAIEAQNEAAVGSVTCEIVDEDGRVIATDTVEGPYVTAFCDGTV